MIDLVVSPINGYACPDDPGEPGTNAPRLSINDQEGRILQELVKNKDVLEIGTGLGISTKVMAMTANKVYTFDIDEWVRENVWPDLPDNVLGFRYPDSFVEVMDCAFIDSLHTYEQCTNDIAFAREHVTPGGMIIFHDLYIQGVAQAVVESGLPFVHIQTTAGMALAWNDIKK